MTDFDANVDKTNEFLAHYGVPGMKWGKHKAEGSSSSERLQKKQNILSARDRLEKAAGKADERYASGHLNNQNKLEASRAAAKDKRRDATANASSKDDVKAAKSEYKTDMKQAKQDYKNGFRKVEATFQKDYAKILDHPDVETANKMTTGEKWATGVGAGLMAGALAGQVLITAAAFKEAH